MTAPVTANGQVSFEKREGKLDELHGRLGFIDRIDMYNKEIAVKGEEADDLSTKELTYRKFLIYRDFYVAPTPVILCEGKTDNIFLKHAIRSLVAQFPQLAQVDAKGKPHLKIRLYKYDTTSTARILGLNSGGSANLKDFIYEYKKNTDKFQAPGQQNPLIVVFDNDSGAKGIAGLAQQMNPGCKPRVDPLTHLVKNL